MNAFNNVGSRPSALLTELKRDSTLVRTRVQHLRSLRTEAGWVPRSRSAASVFALQLNTTPNGEYRK